MAAIEGYNHPESGKGIMPLNEGNQITKQPNNCMRKHFRKSLVLVTLVALLSSFAVLIHSAAPPQGYTGATGEYCTSCHTTNPLNSPGGSTLATGLPDSYTAAMAYPFSITTSHSNTDRKRFGFSIIAVNKNGVPTGTFSTTNPNAGINGNELSHMNAIILASAVKSYTYDNLTWTAPVNPGTADQTVTFYYVGNAANGTGSSAGDYIYAATKTVNLVITYTFTGNGNWDNAANWSNNTIPPPTITGTAMIVIDPPADGECVLNVEQHIGTGTNLVVKTGKRFRIAGNLIINN